MKLEKNTIVSVSLPTTGSNTYMVDTDEGDTVLLMHPLAPQILIRFSKVQLNTVHATIKDSTERGIDYANKNKNYLDYNTLGDLDSICVYFALKRRLTPRQKQTLANICGIIASAKFDNDLGEAMKTVSQNTSLLDEFNMMWYNNFKELFAGRRPITSKKQRGAIFNIAGYVLAELENPTAQK